MTRLTAAARVRSQRNTTAASEVILVRDRGLDRLHRVRLRALRPRGIPFDPLVAGVTGDDDERPLHPYTVPPAMNEDVTYRVFESRDFPGDWAAGAADRGNEGVIYTVLFIGPDAQGRAEEYAAWKNAASVVAS